MADLTTRDARLEAALADLAEARKQWEEMGRPSLSRGSALQLVQHPLVRTIRRAEEAILRMEIAEHQARHDPAESEPLAPHCNPPPPRRAKLKVVNGSR